MRGNRIVGNMDGRFYWIQFFFYLVFLWIDFHLETLLVFFLGGVVFKGAFFYSVGTTIVGKMMRSD